MKEPETRLLVKGSAHEADIAVKIEQDGDTANGHRGPKLNPRNVGRPSLGLTPEEKKRRNALRVRELRVKKRAEKQLANEEYLRTPEGQAEVRY